MVLNSGDATKSDYLRLFNKLEKAHKSKHFISPNQEFSEVYANTLLSLLELSGYTKHSLRRTSQILSSIRAVFDNCSYEEFFMLIRHTKLPSLELEILETLTDFRKTLSDKRLQDETIQSNVRAVLLFLDEAKAIETSIEHRITSLPENKDFWSDEEKLLKLASLM